jgi:Cys-rich protein (TIGR01571 family)
MKSYEYPRVHPPTSLLPPQRPDDSRFSWMDTTADEEHRLWTRNTRRPRTTSIITSPPPIAQQPTQEVGLKELTRMDTQRYPDGAYPYQAQDHGVPQQHHFVQDPRHNGGYPAQPQYIPVQVPQSQFPPEQNSCIPLPQSPEPVKQPPAPSYEPPRGIAPDENPLSPTTPKFTRASTNMAIIPPSSDMSQYSIGTFTPSPQAIRGGSWQHGLCSCAEPSICLTGLFCPCIVYGRTQYRLALRGEKKDPTNMLGYTAINGSCIAFGVLCGINGILAAIQHTRVRKAYNMNSEAGNVAGDCLTGLCCCCCVVAQDEKEVKFREEQARKPAGSKTEGYVAPTAMAFSPRSP